MPAGTVTIYRSNIDDLRFADLISVNIRLMLTTSTYVPDTSTTGHSVLASVTNEISGTGYTAGGIALTGTNTAIANGWKFASGNAVWTAGAGGIPAWRYGVLYYLGSLWGKTNPLIGVFLGDSTPADVPLTADGVSLTVACPANGWLTAVQS